MEERQVRARMSFVDVERCAHPTSPMSYEKRPSAVREVRTSTQA